IERDPDSHLTHYYLGAFYHALARYEEAIVEINRALECSPGHLTIMHALGSIYWAMENFDDAISVFEEVIEIDSVQGRVYWNLGMIYYYKGDFIRSVEYFEEAEKYIPRDFNLYGDLGRSLYWAGKESRANEMLGKAISLAKAYPDVLSLNIASYYGLMGRMDSANYYLEAVNLPDKPEELDATGAFALGESYLILGRKALALEYIESGLSRGYGWLEVRHAPLYKDLADDQEFQEMVTRAEEFVQQ
ncbi:MAG: tetratricopeptide repeat protein, partial [Bacteroidales bacterium]|nr:tetratricopeptide repeat protein [Bacteroidales bacterium]